MGRNPNKDDHIIENRWARFLYRSGPDHYIKTMRLSAMLNTVRIVGVTVPVGIISSPLALAQPQGDSDKYTRGRETVHAALEDTLRLTGTHYRIEEVAGSRYDRITMIRSPFRVTDPFLAVAKLRIPRYDLYMNKDTFVVDLRKPREDIRDKSPVDAFRNLMELNDLDYVMVYPNSELPKMSIRASEIHFQEAVDELRKHLNNMGISVYWVRGTAILAPRKVVHDRDFPFNLKMEISMHHLPTNEIIQRCAQALQCEYTISPGAPNALMDVSASGEISHVFNTLRMTLNSPHPNMNKYISIEWPNLTNGYTLDYIQIDQTTANNCWPKRKK